MAAVCAIIKSIKPNFDFSRVNIATTVYVAKDETANLLNLLEQIDPEITLHVVKEGAGAGGAMLLALIRGASVKSLRERIEMECQNTL